MPVDEGFERALQSENPLEQLRSLALRLSSDGLDRAAVLDKFEEVRQELRQAERESDEDALMEAMDCLVGWCSPHVSLSLPPSGPAEPGSDKA